jgi:hypothetical protein
MGKAMTKRAFFEMLGVPLRNNRWSWGAVRQKDGAVFLLVWQDELELHDGSQFARVTRHAAFIGRSNNCGYRERLKHVERLRGGAPCYLIMCEAINPAESPRKVRQFNADEVFPDGRVEELDGDWWVEVLAAVPVEEVMLSPIGGRV